MQLAVGVVGRACKLDEAAIAELGHAISNYFKSPEAGDPRTGIRKIVSIIETTPRKSKKKFLLAFVSTHSKLIFDVLGCTAAVKGFTQMVIEGLAGIPAANSSELSSQVALLLQSPSIAKVCCLDYLQGQKLDMLNVLKILQEPAFQQTLKIWLNEPALFGALAGRYLVSSKEDRGQVDNCCSKALLV